MLGRSSLVGVAMTENLGRKTCSATTFDTLPENYNIL